MKDEVMTYVITLPAILPAISRKTFQIF